MPRLNTLAAAQLSQSALVSQRVAVALVRTAVYYLSNNTGTEPANVADDAYASRVLANVGAETSRATFLVASLADLPIPGVENLTEREITRSETFKDSIDALVTQSVSELWPVLAGSLAPPTVVVVEDIDDEPEVDEEGEV